MIAAVRFARRATPPALPDRPRCERCHTLVAALSPQARLSAPGDYVVVTQPCQHTVRATKRRCGQPYALVAAHGRPVTYLFGDTFEALARKVETLLEEVRS